MGRRRGPSCCPRAACRRAEARSLAHRSSGRHVRDSAHRMRSLPKIAANRYSCVILSCRAPEKPPGARRAEPGRPASTIPYASNSDADLPGVHLDLMNAGQDVSGFFHLPAGGKRSADRCGAGRQVSSGMNREERAGMPGTSGQSLPGRLRLSKESDLQRLVCKIQEVDMFRPVDRRQVRLFRISYSLYFLVAAAAMWFQWQDPSLLAALAAIGAQVMLLGSTLVGLIPVIPRFDGHSHAWPGDPPAGVVGCHECVLLRVRLPVGRP